MKNQLFRISPELEVTESLLKLFGIKDINDNHSFTRSNLEDLKTVEKIQENIEKLTKYYIPCKAKKYLLTTLNEKKCITILRQFLKYMEYNLKLKEKYINGVKNYQYFIVCNKKKVVIDFD